MSVAVPPQDEWEDFINVLVNDDNAEKLIMRIRWVPVSQAARRRVQHGDEHGWGTTAPITWCTHRKVAVALCVSVGYACLSSSCTSLHLCP